MEELFNGQLSLQTLTLRKVPTCLSGFGVDRRVNAMDRLTDDVINELIQLFASLPTTSKPARRFKSRKAVYAP